MSDIGAEVGQKMRSAIKAKLLELNCYVDDELPDYVMVMVANKRSKSQMKEDLQLFLSTKTATFVDWLHIVLKKLKEVTITNPDLLKKTIKQKATDVPDIDIKKEKKLKKILKVEGPEKSLTDDLPINANRLSEQRKIIVLKDNKTAIDTFDIPPLSEVSLTAEDELEDLNKKIKKVKDRLGVLVQEEQRTPPPKRKIITFEPEEPEAVPRKKSVLERLGKPEPSKIQKRLGVMSKVSVPLKQAEEPETVVKKDVPSVVKIKPRIMPDAPLANKNLLLKAVAEAQKSVAQTPQVGAILKPDALYTKSFKSKQTASNGAVKPKFIVTLDGLEKRKDPMDVKERKTPSPIIFHREAAPITPEEELPERVPEIQRPLKTKERCKYWPGCRQGGKCEFLHPSAPCEKFPHCKFGDKCLFLHPTCKFGASCTRRDCPYTHNLTPKQGGPSQTICKFYPNCTNISCAFSHPKPCKFGKYCSFKAECSYSHSIGKSSLTWTK